ncbi:MAG: plastocyanin/azurin family copper-binding protein [Natronomonas sp.]
MSFTRRRILAATGTSIALSGCVGGDDSADDSSGVNSTDSPTNSPGDPTVESGGSDSSEDLTVMIRSQEEFGDVLVGSDEMTLYNFDADTQGDPSSACDGDCAEAWPPLTVEWKPIAGDNVEAELTTFDRGDGTTQVAANGWPLYFFDGDEAPGDVAGQGVNEVWWVLEPDGTPIRTTDGNTEVESNSEADETVLVGVNNSTTFDPESLEIESGTKVAFVWDSSGHNIAVREQPEMASWDGVPGVQDEGFSHSHMFDVRGEYEYVCEPHETQGMMGSILVNHDGGSGSGPSY